ncbi:putative defensin-like protein 244 [Mercurialis annua]|uniref:putative defensin-like protein 244 n=1 Tax=Mercurialis annua TaxID=3986 RepID=UPI00215E6C86|nr:putative defensin-like protein 244 [Mercurialis annua]
MTMNTTKTLFLISCIVMMLSLSTAIPQGNDLKWCPKKDTFLGGPCPANGGTQCLLDFMGKYGASSMPKNCICSTLGANSRSCSCDVVCQQY